MKKSKLGTRKQENNDVYENKIDKIVITQLSNNTFEVLRDWKKVILSKNELTVWELEQAIYNNTYDEIFDAEIKFREGVAKLVGWINSWIPEWKEFFHRSGPGIRRVENYWEDKPTFIWKHAPYKW